MKRERTRDREQLAAVAETLALALASTMIVAVVALGAALLQGYRPVIITTGNMTPTAPTGSVVIAQPATLIAPGDILVMRREGRATVTHRVVEVEVNGAGHPYAITRGDANSDIDAAPYPIGSDELVGRWVVPGLGRVLLFAGSPIVGLVVVLTAVFVLVATVLRKIWHRDPQIAPEARVDRPRASRTVRMRRVAAATILGLLFGCTGVAWSYYLGVASVGGNVFSAGACYDARLGTVQSGQLTNTTNGTQTASIAAVDTASSFLLFSTRSSSNEPSDSVVMGVLSDPTTIAFTRQTDAVSPPPIVIEWSVVEYSCGVSVRRGVVNGNGTSQIDIPVGAIDPATTFVTGSFAPTATATDHQLEQLQVFEVADSTTVRVRTDPAGVMPATSQYAWQAVTFSVPGDAAVQREAITLGAGTGSASISLASPVDPDSTLLVASTTSSSTGSEIGERVVRVRLTSPTTVEVSRLATTESVEVVVQVVELRDGTTVQHGVIDLAPSETSGTASLAPVDLNRTVAMSTVTSAGSLGGGSSDHITDDTIGEASGAVSFANSSTISVERDAAASSASFPWQAITWGGPSWADPLTPFRQRIDITAGSVDAPNGYTTSLTFDHAALVDSGLALASGDDARVWRHDGTSWTELDRVLDENSSFNAANTTIWFRTQESIAASETVSYWLYFGNPSPSPVLADPANVWLLVEGFEDGTLGQFEDRTGGTSWYRALPWTRRMPLTIDAAAVPATLTDHQVLIHLTEPDLATHAQADGSDIRFTAADGTTALAHDLETFDAGTGALTAWVRVPNVSASTDTTVYLLYGAADAPSQEDPRTTWSGQTAAWHFDRDPTGPAPTLDDAGPGSHDGLALGNPALVVTASGPAADLDGTTDRFEAAPFDLSIAPLTVAAWFRPDSIASDAVLVSQGNPTGAGVFELAVDTSAGATGRFRIRAGGAVHEVTGGAITAGSWHHLVGVWDGTTATLYLDGAPVGSVAASGSAPNGSTIPVVLGGDASGTSTLDGVLGEVHLDDTTWSAAEASFTEANMRTPNLVVTPGSPVSGTWFDQGDWTVRRPLTVDADRVTGPLTDYPLLVHVADPDLGTSAQADGDDLVFTAADGVTRLDHVVEEWNSGPGTLIAWVRVPALDDAADTELFLYLGNPTAVDQGDPTGVWGPDADLVLLGH